MKKLIKKLNLFLVFTFILASVFVTNFTSTAKAYTATASSYKSYTVINDFQGVADYIHNYGHLPSNFITKSQAYALGWEPGEDLWDYAPGKSIGGDVFTNSERVLPTKSGRVWHECDINYNGGHRGADRLLYSNDGLIYGTTDHYNTFTRYY